jgi:2,4-dienoyl-CoA reductase-like NADH-dependent reductase (Old Yellow Enzyme family)
LALKLNAADYVQGGMTEAQSLEHLTEIAQWQLFDIIEVSGGDYENPGQLLSSKLDVKFS